MLRKTRDKTLIQPNLIQPNHSNLIQPNHYAEEDEGQDTQTHARTHSHTLTLSPGWLGWG